MSNFPARPLVDDPSRSLKYRSKTLGFSTGFLSSFDRLALDNIHVSEELLLRAAIVATSFHLYTSQYDVRILVRIDWSLVISLSSARATISWRFRFFSLHPDDAIFRFASDRRRVLLYELLGPAAGHCSLTNDNAFPRNFLVRPGAKYR